MQTVASSITFGRFEGSGPRQATQDVTLPNPATSATAILTGFNVSFAPSEGDHHLGNLDVRLDADRLSDTAVRVTATFGLRDWSGNWDDQYEGQLFFAVVAE
jgi:hypothetical protein